MQCERPQLCLGERKPLPPEAPGRLLSDPPPGRWDVLEKEPRAPSLLATLSNRP